MLMVLVRLVICGSALVVVLVVVVVVMAVVGRLVAMLQAPPLLHGEG